MTPEETSATIQALQHDVGVLRRDLGCNVGTYLDGAQLHAGVIPQFTTRKRYLRKDGTTLWVQLTVSLERDAQGRPSYDVAAFEDVTDAVRAEERLRASESRGR